MELPAGLLLEIYTSTKVEHCMEYSKTNKIVYDIIQKDNEE